MQYISHYRSPIGNILLAAADWKKAVVKKSQHLFCMSEPDKEMNVIVRRQEGLQKQTATYK